MKISNSKLALLVGSALIVTSSAGLLATRAVSFPQPSNGVTPSASEKQGVVFPPIDTRKDPDAMLDLESNTVSVMLVNSSPSRISYVVAPDRDFIQMEPGEEVMLDGLDVPANIGFTQLDGGLTGAEIVEVNEDEQMVTIGFSHLSPTEYYGDPLSIDRTIIIGEMGGVYID